MSCLKKREDFFSKKREDFLVKKIAFDIDLNDFVAFHWLEYAIELNWIEYSVAFSLGWKRAHTRWIWIK